MTHPSIRVRFAPAPTGLMHLGNVRTALMNYLFARQKQGTYVIRIEDTDQQRNFDPQAHEILDDLAWLHLTYDEGPGKGGPYAPYFQSEREPIYQEYLLKLQQQHLIYRCFCTTEELEKKRQRQIALKQPPRYDRTCLALSVEESDARSASVPFIWRMKLNQQGSATVKDLAYGELHFDYKNFSDFPLTRSDGSVTFIFANFVDDFVMKISHVLRGEDHLTNTACQVALFQAFNTPAPIYWHLPLLFNSEGKKLSKRDFGFSLKDLRQGGYLPQAICNYLAIIGGGTFETEIMSLDELIKACNFDQIHSTGQIRYDVEKLTWLNHKWIERLDPHLLTDYCMPFLVAAYPAAKSVDKTILTKLIQHIKTDLTTLTEVTNALHFYFVLPSITLNDIEHYIPAHTVTKLTAITKQTMANSTQETFIEAMKQAAKAENISVKECFTFLRLLLMGDPEGPSMHDLVAMLGYEELVRRINKVVR